MENSADILIVTVTDVESRAVLTAFARATGQKSCAIAIGDRVYRDLGTLQGTRAFLALSEMGAGGVGASQQTVQKGIAALRPTAVVMVGIAFGMNEQKQALGDILVSRQLMLYDLQRVGASQITPRGDRPHGSARLLNYFTSAALDWSGARVRFGLLLTGDKLVDNIDYRGQLQRLESEAIGGEMEGAGLYVACQDAKVDWVLVKAICDWADGNKAQDKDARQQQAADNAAAFVVHTLQHAPLNRTTDTTPEDRLQNVSHKVIQHQQIGSIVVTGTGNSIAIQQGAESPNPSTPVHSTGLRHRPAPFPSQPPTRSAIRKLLGAIFRTNTDLIAFCIDQFPAIARRLSNTMDRSECENLLLQLAETDEILASLRNHDPVAVGRHLTLLEQE